MNEMRVGAVGPRRLRTVAALVATTSWLVGSGGVRGQCHYEVTLVQGPPCAFVGPAPLTGTGINESGEIAGYYGQCGSSDSEAARWTPSGGLTTLPRPGFAGAEGWDINEAGVVAGKVDTFGNLTIGAIWPTGQLVLLGMLPGANYSYANAINNLGQVVGRSGNNIVGPQQAFIWEYGQMTALELPFGPNAEATDINDCGQVVGWMGGAPQDAHAFIWEDGEVVDLGVIPGGVTARAWAINDDGDVVGFGQIPSDEFPFAISLSLLWREGQVTVLGTLPGYQMGGAFDINNRGQVVGQASWSPDRAIDHAFIWQNGVMTDLNTLAEAVGVDLTSAHAINQEGIITGEAQLPGGQVRAFILTPIDPPFSDLDGDCATGVTDLVMLILDWGKGGTSADLDGSGAVGVEDLLLLVMNWG